MLSKLRSIGIRGTILDWFTSYLHDRRQIVKIDETLSDPGTVKYGIPQGSVLGPLLFLIYFNSIFEIGLIGYPTAFADDLALSYATPLKGETCDLGFVLKTDLQNLGQWFYHNRLTVSDKSKTMIFGRQLSNLLVQPQFYHVYTCDSNQCSPQCFPLEFVDEFKYLGLTIDSKLNWKSHINNTRKSVCWAIHKFYILRKCCPSDTLRKLYHALVESILMYGISSWGGTYFTNIEDLYIAQKRVIKLIYKRPQTTPTIPLFRELNLLPFRYLYVYKVLKLFFIRSNSFHNITVHTYNTRNPNSFNGVRCNSEKFRRFYLYMAPYFFHMLPNNVKSLSTVRKFKFEREIRSWLLSLDDIEQYF